MPSCAAVALSSLVSILRIVISGFLTAPRSDFTSRLVAAIWRLAVCSIAQDETNTSTIIELAAVSNPFGADASVASQSRFSSALR